jgi:hypothetical protein
MMSAHVAGVPIEELIFMLATSSGAAIVVARFRWRRLRRIADTSAPPVVKR